MLAGRVAGIQTIDRGNIHVRLDQNGQPSDDMEWPI